MSKTKPPRLLDVEFYLDTAKQHGQASDPDHEAGDLQDFLRRAWALFTPDQRIAFARDEHVHSVLGLFGELDEDLAKLPQRSPSSGRLVIDALRAAEDRLDAVLERDSEVKQWETKDELEAHQRDLHAHQTVCAALRSLGVEPSGGLSANAAPAVEAPVGEDAPQDNLPRVIKSYEEVVESLVTIIYDGTDFDGLQDLIEHGCKGVREYSNSLLVKEWALQHQEALEISDPESNPNPETPEDRFERA